MRSFVKPGASRRGRVGPFGLSKWPFLLAFFIVPLGIALPAEPLPNDQLLSMLRQIYPDCDVGTDDVSLFEFSLTEKATSQPLHLPPRWATEGVTATTPPLERKWYFGPDDVKVLQADLDDDGKTETCLAFDARGAPRWRDLAFHQLAVFAAADDGRPRLIGFRKIDRIWAFAARPRRLEVADFGKRKTLIYTFAGTDSPATPRFHEHFAEIYVLQESALNCAFSKPLGHSGGGSGVCPYSAIATLDHEDLDGDGLSELLVLDEAVDSKYWSGHETGVTGQGYDHIVRHTPEIYRFQDGAFRPAPQLLTKSRTLLWEHLSATLFNAWPLYDTSNRAHYSRLEDGALTIFGGEIRNRNPWIGDAPRPIDSVRILAGRRNDPIWTFTVYRNAPGQKHFPAAFDLDDYQRAQIHTATATEMDYSFRLSEGRDTFALRRHSRVLKGSPTASGFLIHEKLTYTRPENAVGEIQGFDEHLVADGSFLAFDALPRAPALICRSAETTRTALVLVKVYLNFDEVAFVFPEGKQSDQTNQVTVKCKVRGATWWPGRPPVPIGDGLYFAAIIDTTKGSWRDEVYACIGRALEALDRHLAKAN